MNKDIKNAIKDCDKMENCVKCSKWYERVQGDKGFIPCNCIRLNYGVSIWDYKGNRKESVEGESNSK